MDPFVGRTVSHYRIIERLGAGGMGVVYKAEDTKLGRLVALKFLPPELTGDTKARARFIQEARAASAIDHPNVCTIFEVDEAENGQVFISMACYQGKTLKQKIGEGVIDLAEAVDVAVQIAQGLSAAHARGIVHRDIKPANIFMVSDGRVKIVDFGIAKLAGQLKLTSTGRTMGTVAYMSPEQGSGQEAGATSDIWALGVILYEMVTGELPFTGDYEVAVLYSIMHEEPRPLGALRPGVPEELAYITRKALAKNTTERYKTAGELLADLDALKRQLGRDNATPARAWRFRRAERRLSIAIAASAIAVAAIIVAWQMSAGRKSRPAFMAGQPRQITSGYAWHDEPALSPDGTRIAFTSDESGNKDIWIVGVRGGNPSRLTTDGSADYHPAWFPEGTTITFASDRGGETGIWRMDQLGGGATMLIPRAVDPAVSPDGERIAFAIPGPNGQLRIGVAPLANTAQVTILTHTNDGLWEHRYPTWSPDGRTLCYAAQNDLWTVPSSGGDARPLSKGGERDSDPAWGSSGKYVFFSSSREGTLALWRITANGGKPERFTWGTGHDHDPSICADGSRLAYSTRTAHMTLHLRSIASGKETRLAGQWDDYMAAMAPDGSKIVFASMRFGRDLDLWTQPLANGLPVGEAQRLTDEVGHASHPTFSPDGKWLAYYRVLNEERDIYIIPASGGQPIRFTSDPANDMHPSWSPDGSRIAFVTEGKDTWSIWIRPVKDGQPAGEPKRVTDTDIMASAPAWSPDGRQIVFSGFKNNQSEVWIIPADGGAPARRVTTGASASRARWDRSTGELLVSGTWGEDDMTLRRVSPRDGAATSFVPPVVLGLKSAPPFFDVSADGHVLVFSREEYGGNIWVFETVKRAF